MRPSVDDLRLALAGRVRLQALHGGGHLAAVPHGLLGARLLAAVHQHMVRDVRGYVGREARDVVVLLLVNPDGSAEVGLLLLGHGAGHDERELAGVGRG